MEIEFEKELLDLKAECRENPNIHPHCEHVVDLAISEIKRLEQQYETDTVWYHNKWMEAIKNSQASRWIPVSERLPTKEDANSKGKVIAWCTSFNGTEVDLNWRLVETDGVITHWRVGMEPPQEVE